MGEKRIAYGYLTIGLSGIGVLLSFLLIHCGTDSYSGVSEVGNPSDKVSLVGMIYDCDGNPSEGVALRLRPSDFNPAKDTGVPVRFSDTTGVSGDFRISGIPQGSYTLTGMHSENGYRCFYPEIDLHSATKNSIQDTVWRPGTALIYLATDRVSESNAVFVRGTDVFAPATAREIALEGIVEDQLDHLYFYDAAEERSMAVHADSLISAYYLSSDSFIQLDYSPHAPSGPTEVSRDSAFSYRASLDPFPPYKDCMGEEMIRMTWGNGDTTEWKVGAEFTYRWSAPGTYAVQSQTRCEMMLGEREVKFLSRWSDSLRVQVVE